MKEAIFSVALLAIFTAAAAIGATMDNTASSHIESAPIAEQTAPQPTSYHGAYFNAKYVVETFNYNNYAFYMVYDCIDAGFDMEVVRLDRDSYKAVEKAVKSRDYRDGSFSISQPFETTTYSINFDE